MSVRWPGASYSCHDNRASELNARARSSTVQLARTSFAHEMKTHNTKFYLGPLMRFGSACCHAFARSVCSGAAAGLQCYRPVHSMHQTQQGSAALAPRNTINFLYSSFWCALAEKVQQVLTVHCCRCERTEKLFARCAAHGTPYGDATEMTPAHCGVERSVSLCGPILLFRMQSRSQSSCACAPQHLCTPHDLHMPACNRTRR